MKPIALITGATSGIGEATARQLAQRFFLIICGRRRDRLEKLAEELKVKTDVEILSFDVRNREEVFEKIGSLKEQWRNIDVLINNAGNAHGRHEIHEGDMDDWDAMIDINVKGLLYVTKAVVPGMVERGHGHILNVGSIAGIDVYPQGNVYSASKFAVDALTKGMRQDLHKYGVKISEIKPGLVETEFSEVRHKGDKDEASKVYAGMKPLSAQDVAESILFMVSRPENVVIGDLLILPKAQATSVMVDRQIQDQG